MIAKPRLATAWLGGCSGCHMSLLDMDERFLDLLQHVDLVYSPFMDVKRYPEHVDIALVEGAVATEDHRRELREIRMRTTALVALGDCAAIGNVTALRNPLGSAEPVLRRVYLDPGSHTDARFERSAVLPRLLDRVEPLNAVVQVDFWIPGCPPLADAIHDVLVSLIVGRAPALPSSARFG